MSLQSLLYGTGPEAEADLAEDRRQIEDAQRAFLALPVIADDAVLDVTRGEQWLTIDDPAQVRDLVRRHGCTALGRSGEIQTFATSEILEEFVVRAQHVRRYGFWLPRNSEQGEGSYTYTRIALRGQLCREETAQLYRWSVIRAQPRPAAHAT